MLSPLKSINSPAERALATYRLLNRLQATTQQLAEARPSPEYAKAVSRNRRWVQKYKEFSQQAARSGLGLRRSYHADFHYTYSPRRHTQRSFHPRANPVSERRAQFPLEYGALQSCGTWAHSLHICFAQEFPHTVATRVGQLSRSTRDVSLLPTQRNVPARSCQTM